MGLACGTTNFYKTVKRPKEDAHSLPSIAMTVSTPLNPYKDEIDFARLALQDAEFAKV